MLGWIMAVLLFAVTLVGFADVSYARDSGAGEKAITAHHGGGYGHRGGGRHRGGWRR